MSYEPVTVHINLADPLKLTVPFKIPGGATLISVTYEYRNTASKNANLKLQRRLAKLDTIGEIWEDVLSRNNKGGTLPGDNARIPYVEPTQFVAGGVASAEIFVVLPENLRWVASDPGPGLAGEVYLYMMVQKD